MISALRDGDGAQQKALATMLPITATTAKHAQGLRYARNLVIELSYAPVTSPGIAAGPERVKIGKGSVRHITGH